MPTSGSGANAAPTHPQVRLNGLNLI